MEVPIFQVDSFTAEPFKGNPAAVCLLDEPQPDLWMQRVAAEMNLSETAFVLPREDGFSLRWFTPTIEVPLCGHATLASAHILWETGRVSERESPKFHTLSGILVARRDGPHIELELPAMELQESAAPGKVLESLQVTPTYVARTPDRALDDMDFLLELDSEESVRAIKPDFEMLRTVPAGIIVTARAGSDSYDFVSRYFAPYGGIDEDPVTGVAHCSLTPHWSRRLGKTKLVGYQASSRGGVVRARLSGGKVFLSGEAVTVLRGTLIG